MTQAHATICYKYHFQSGWQGIHFAQGQSPSRLSLVLYFYKNYLRMRLCFLCLLILSFMFSYSQHTTTLFEQSGGTQTPTYDEVIEWWHKLDASSSIVNMKAMDSTDAGFPLHLIIVS